MNNTSTSNPKRQTDSQKVEKKECTISCRACKDKHTCKKVCPLVKKSFSA